MTYSVINYKGLATNPVFRIPMFDTTIGDLICAMSADSMNKTNGGYIDHRGLHWLDKRFSAASGIQMIKGVPMATPAEIRKNRPAQIVAIKGKGKNTKEIKQPHYERSLVIRSIRAQILNPIMRLEGWAMITKVAERLRSMALRPNSRFLKMAANPMNVQYFTNWLLHG
jgi:hypothetical protein